MIGASLTSNSVIRLNSEERLCIFQEDCSFSICSFYLFRNGPNISPPLNVENVVLY